MDRIQQVTWFAGLFEGEGCFTFANGKPKALTIQMTDLDVLERVHEFFGGTLAPMKKRQEHWKDSWVWNIYGVKAVELAREMLPFLGLRRTRRCNEFIAGHRSMETFVEQKIAKTLELAQQARSLRTQGLTQQQIADRLGCERSYVSRLLKKVA